MTKNIEAGKLGVFFGLVLGFFNLKKPHNHVFSNKKMNLYKFNLFFCEILEKMFIEL